MLKNSRKKFSKRKSSIYLLFTMLLILFVFISFFINRSGNLPKTNITARDENLYLLWEDKEFSKVIEITEGYLDSDIYNVEYLRFHGFANFYLAISQISLEMKIPLINQSILSLRKAFVLAEDEYKKDIAYILGKAYYYKGPNYADLAIKYLDISRERGYLGKDIYEFKGLAYYELGQYKKSIEEFESLPKEMHNPEVKYRISMAYNAIGEIDKQEEYLLYILNNPGERGVKTNAYIDIAKIYFERGEYNDAINNSNEALKSSADNYSAQLILAKSLFLTDNERDAKKIFRKLLKQRPGDKELVSWLNR